MSVKTRLSIMMFLEYAIYGAWIPVLTSYLITDLGFTGMEAGVIVSLLPLATILSPFIGGQLADRWFATEKVIAFFQLAAGVLMIVMSTISDYRILGALMFVYALLYAPTLALTNSIAFINMKNTEQEFGAIRVWGSIGWVAAGLLLSGWRIAASNGIVPGYAGDMLFLAGVFSVLMGFQAFTLPHTPPRTDSASPWAFVEAFRMLRDRNFLVFIVIAFITATQLMFYFVLTAPYFTSDAIGIPSSWIAGVLTIAQIAEMFVMAYLLQRFLPRFGVRLTITVGILSWAARYLVYAIGTPVSLVVLSLTLQGFCYVFFFVAAFIHVDNAAPPDVRASAQSLIALVTLGVGNYVGSIFAGWTSDRFTDAAGVVNWTGVFAVPTVILVVAGVAFFALFRDRTGPVELDG